MKTRRFDSESPSTESRQPTTDNHHPGASWKPTTQFLSGR
jgi:hypothetical protein